MPAPLSRTLPVRHPSIDELKLLKFLANHAGQEDVLAFDVARLASHLGLMLIGSTTLQEIHHPVPPEEHTFCDIGDDYKIKIAPEALDRPTLQVSRNAEIAVLNALFGSPNSRAERVARCEPHTGPTNTHYGWGFDHHKTERGMRIHELFVEEEAAVRAHARPALINAARGNALFKGYIHCVADNPNFARIRHEVAQYLGPDSCRTIITIPVRGDLDLPVDILPTTYPMAMTALYAPAEKSA